ncbi:DNA translocase FtsK [Neobacillus cucumis]|uniref:DNA translocase FtsK n=2 Tax=Neobacillus cucumis TaxID=1740721 RepID=UPI00203C3B29|nr:DNA translocase FtsK [Neobacillus cucumis]MCM3725437.1 DNA translocase FtsK [Neobacillus cucumis]
MSWIQNFFQKLRKEEEDEGKITDYFLKRESDNHLTISQYDSLKDLDARIAYQYPKGDSPPPGMKRSNQRQITSRSKRLADLSKKSKLVESTTIVPETPKVKSVIKEQKSRPSGPFHPTEIPSPVFGFNRPQKTTSVVEHELSDFLNDELDEQLNKTIGISPSLNKVLLESDPYDIGKQSHHNQIHHNQIHQTPMIKKRSASSEKKEYEQAVPIEFRFEETIQAETKGILFEEMVQPKGVEPAFKEDIQTEAVEPSAFVEDVQTEALELILGARVQAEAVKHELKENVQTGTIESAEKADHQLDQPGEVEADIETETPLAARSRLPFNVMMLKQDKQKWEERKRKKEFSQEQHLPKEKTLVEEVPDSEMPSLLEKVQNEGFYVLPKSNLLSPPVTEVLDTEWIEGQKELLNLTLKNFNVGASVVNVTQGPSVTRFEVQPEPGVKVNKITNLSDDIKLSLAARDIRIEAPIPGKHTIGIEVPNQKSRPVLINEIIGSSVFKESASPLTAVLGLDIAGKPIVTDLKKMPHGLIAGATGSGKSVCINSILISLLYKARPEELKLLLIDPKMVELAPYNRVPHLVSPVITDVKAATAALKWAVDEMERRYELFAHTGVRDINRFNELAVQHKRYSDKLPFILIVIDELADLMMMSPADVEEAICRIAQKARACGIHLIVATQRPSVDVITGLIKANIPTRIAFSVSSQVDSRTIIDIGGAERLLGRGDMLFLENGSSKPVRLQGTFVSDEEIDLVVAHVREQQEPDYLFEQEELLKKAQVVEDEDELFYDACEFIVHNGGASTSSLQRRFKIGYNRAARLMDMLEQNGYITSANGSKPREVLITEADLESMQD